MNLLICSLSRDHSNRKLLAEYIWNTSVHSAAAYFGQDVQVSHDRERVFGRVGAGGVPVISRNDRVQVFGKT